MEKNNQAYLDKLQKDIEAIQPAKISPETPDKVVFAGRQEKARGISYGIMKSMDYDSAEMFTLDDVFVVWFSKTLQNWKALVSASYKGAPYIEVTHNGDKKETYFDVYRKIENIVIPD